MCLNGRCSKSVAFPPSALAISECLESSDGAAACNVATWEIRGEKEDEKETVNVERRGQWLDALKLTARCWLWQWHSSLRSICFVAFVEIKSGGRERRRTHHLSHVACFFCSEKNAKSGVLKSNIRILRSEVLTSL